MTPEVFRILMEQRMRDWLKELGNGDPDLAFDPVITGSRDAVERFLAWCDRKEMEL